MKPSPLFANGVDIELAKLNLVVGGNSAGKTALCDWIAGHVDARHLERWHRTCPEDARGLRTETHYCDPDPHCIAVDFLDEDYPRYTLDGEATVSAAGAVKAVFPSQLSFSAIASTRHEDIDFDDVAWSGWKLIRLHGDPPDVFAE